LGDTKKKRELFIKIVLPLILDENEKILEDRKKLFKILGKNFNTVGERVWLKRRFKEFKIEDNDLSKLKMRMDIIPVSIALAQAANESGWGTSRFALEGNALFGQWTWSKKGISPKNKDPDQSHKILQFQILKASVRAYKNNLNTHNAYKEFREVRAKLRQSGTTITGLALIKYLKNYSAIGEKYTEIIKINSLIEEVVKKYNTEKIKINFDSNIKMPLRQNTFKRCLNNLIDNSLSYGKKVEISTKKIVKDLIILIDDDGPGIPQEEYEKVMKPFYRIDKSRGQNKSGVGLGLSIANDIVRSHWGNILLEKSPLNGLRVKISLPL